MIIPLGKKHIPEIVRIHIQALKGDFLPSLGEKFLETMYQGLIEKPGVYGFANIEKNKITGFIVGTKNMDKFFSTALKSNFIKMSVLVLLRFLQKPQIAKNVLETFLYSKKESGPKAELVVIAIIDKWQGKGIGKKLVKTMENTFKAEKIKKYKLTVYSDKKAVKFYEKLKFSKIADFNLYNRSWYTYEKEII